MLLKTLRSKPNYELMEFTIQFLRGEPEVPTVICFPEMCGDPPFYLTAIGDEFTFFARVRYHSRYPDIFDELDRTFRAGKYGPNTWPENLRFVTAFPGPGEPEVLPWPERPKPTQRKPEPRMTWKRWESLDYDSRVSWAYRVLPRTTPKQPIVIHIPGDDEQTDFYVLYRPYVYDYKPSVTAFERLTAYLDKVFGINRWPKGLQIIDITKQPPELKPLVRE